MLIKSEAIKAVFQKFNINPATVGVKFEETPEKKEFKATGKLADGTEIMSTADAWGEGVDVFVKDAEGNDIPLAADKYQLEDGKIMTVGEDGKVVSIAEVEVEEMSSADLMKVVESLSERISALEGSNTQLSADLEAANKKAADAEAELKSTKTELAALKKKPAVPSVKDKTTEQKFASDKSDEPKPGSREYFLQFTAKTNAN